MPKSNGDKPRPSTGMREAFAKLLEDPSRDKLHELIKGSGGEFKDLDFKVEWPAKAALAKQVLAMGNIGGGLLVIGVSEGDDGALTPAGLSSFTDKSDITSGLKNIIPSVLVDRVTVHDFDYPTGEYGVIQGKKFQVMFVEPDENHLPYVAMKEADKIAPGVVYVRREGLIDAATYDEVQRILNKRIEGGHSSQSELDLRSHIDQLKVLYGSIEPRKQNTANIFPTRILLRSFFGEDVRNPLYPEESFDKFINTQISKKKDLIAKTLGTS